jgi:hypothetical protein
VRSDGGQESSVAAAVTCGVSQGSVLRLLVSFSHLRG